MDYIISLWPYVNKIIVKWRKSKKSIFKQKTKIHPPKKLC